MALRASRCSFVHQTCARIRTAFTSGRSCGVGEYVLYASGSSARQTEATKDRPCDAVIMAIVDTWEIGGEQLYEKHGQEHGYGDG